MARIRIVDDWLRSPASPPTHYRSIMVVAERWAEQRVLMRAYADSADQTRPTIVLHGTEVAIGPAGVDPNGEWGVHVQPPVDGLAQQLKEQLELAAKRLSGSKGNAPRLADEAPSFERKRTNNWAPGSPRDVPESPIASAGWDPAVAASQHAMHAGASVSYSNAAFPQAPPPAPPYHAPPPFTASGQTSHAPPPFTASGQTSHAPPPFTASGHPNPQLATVVGPPQAYPVPQHQAAAYVPQAPAAEYIAPSGIASDGGMTVSPPSNPSLRLTPLPVSSDQHQRRRRRTTASHRVPTGARTALGYTSGAGAQNAVIRLGLRPAAAARLGRLVDRTVPADFQITNLERDVLNLLAEKHRVSARAIGELVGVVDAVAWMEQLVSKLERYGLDLIAPGEPSGSDPTYVLRA